jgi:hypothetical protein
MTANEKQELRQSWVRIVMILKETGYDFMYMDDITRVANVIRKELELDK